MTSVFRPLYPKVLAKDFINRPIIIIISYYRWELRPPGGPPLSDRHEEWYAGPLLILLLLLPRVALAPHLLHRLLHLPPHLQPRQSARDRQHPQPADGRAKRGQRSRPRGAADGGQFPRQLDVAVRAGGGRRGRRGRGWAAVPRAGAGQPGRRQVQRADPPPAGGPVLARHTGSHLQPCRLEGQIRPQQ